MRRVRMSYFVVIWMIAISRLAEGSNQIDGTNGSHALSE
jgi:hypothetical protein